MAKLLLVLLLLPGLSSCGYSLRGSAALSSGFETLHLQSQQPNSELTRLLQRSLRQAGVELRDGVEAGAGIASLNVGSERVVSRPITINPRARAAQYEIRLAVDINASRDDDEILAPQTLTVERRYFEDIENIAGNRDEVAIITSEMRRDLVNQLLRRLEASL